MLDQVDIARLMSDNIQKKFISLADQLSTMKVKQLNELQYVDCGMNSDTFNTVFGLPDSMAEIDQVTQYYKEEKKPAAWWFSEPKEGFWQYMQQLGWLYEEVNVGMYLPINSLIETEFRSPLTDIQICTEPSHYEDFGEVLSSIFEQFNSVEADNVRSVYRKVAEKSAVLPNQFISLVGYCEEKAVATTTLIITDGVAGLYDIATVKSMRKQGIASEMLHTAIKIARQNHIPMCVLQASPDGLNLYKKAGFLSLKSYEVWNLPA